MVFGLDTHKKPQDPYDDALGVGASTSGAFPSVPAYVPVWSTGQHGFPLRHLSRHTPRFGFQTGDLVQAVISRGTWTGRATVKARGPIRVGMSTGVHPTTSHRHGWVLQRGNGGVYPRTPSNPERRKAESSAA